MRIERLRPGEKLSLKNDGTLELFFIGVGSAFALTLNQTNFLIIKGEHHAMVDFGMTGPQALFQTAGLRPTDIEVILPTHLHADHVGGIECFALTNRYVGQRFMKKPKLTAIVGQDAQQALWDCTLRGGMEWNEEDMPTKRRLSFGDYFQVIRPRWKEQQPREVFEVKFGNIRLEMFRTKHIPDSAGDWRESFVGFGLLIDNRVLFSGDTRFDPELIEMYGHRAETIFHDVQFFPEGVHAPLESLKTLPPEIKEKMHLVHYPDNWREQDIAGFAGWTQQGVRYIFD